MRWVSKKHIFVLLRAWGWVLIFDKSKKHLKLYGYEKNTLLTNWIQWGLHLHICLRKESKNPQCKGNQFYFFAFIFETSILIRS